VFQQRGAFAVQPVVGLSAQPTGQGAPAVRGLQYEPPLLYQFYYVTMLPFFLFAFRARGSYYSLCQNDNSPCTSIRYERALYTHDVVAWQCAMPFAVLCADDAIAITSIPPSIPSPIVPLLPASLRYIAKKIILFGRMHHNRNTSYVAC